MKGNAKKRCAETIPRIQRTVSNSDCNSNLVQTEEVEVHYSTNGHLQNMVPMYPDDHKKQKRIVSSRQSFIPLENNRGKTFAKGPPHPAFAEQEDPTKTMERWSKRYNRVAIPGKIIANQIQDRTEKCPLEASEEEKRYQQFMYHRAAVRHEDTAYHNDAPPRLAAPSPRHPEGRWIYAEHLHRTSILPPPDKWEKVARHAHKALRPQAPYWSWKPVPANRHESRVHIPYDRRQVEATDEAEQPRVIVAVSKEECTPPSSNDGTHTLGNSASSTCKRNVSPSPEIPPKRVKPMGGLDLLVMASMEVAPIKEGPPGCSCPKSRCVALYCECFKAGRRCEEGLCTCVKCKNTIDESGPHGARTLAIRSILARNPRAFSTSTNSPKPPLEPGEVACNCVRSRCLKLYCTCFQKGKECREGVCSCVGCLNTKKCPDRQFAIQALIQKRPDAFDTRVKEVGLGCACKNNRCIRKYCECFRNSLACTEKCTCANCKNQKVGYAL